MNTTRPENTTRPDIHPGLSVGQLASTLAGASRVFHRHGLDFCCGGQVSLAEACGAGGLDPAAILAEIEAEADNAVDFERWDAKPLPEVIDHVLERFHEPHRQELPRLIAMAEKVEQVHADKDACPHGLAAHLARMRDEMELHMRKEEQVLFPLLRDGHGRAATVPIQVMEQEHRDHGTNLERLRELTNAYTPPAEACGTWRALYIGLAELERDLMQHIHIENNILFPRALRG